jgi:hypothetical protein
VIPLQGPGSASRQFSRLQRLALRNPSRVGDSGGYWWLLVPPSGEVPALCSPPRVNGEPARWANRPKGKLYRNSSLYSEVAAGLCQLWFSSSTAGIAALPAGPFEAGALAAPW